MVVAPTNPAAYLFRVDVRQVSQMSRYKGRSSSKAVERDFPHIMEIVVLPGGLGKQLDTMYDWHRERGIEARRGSGRRDEDRDIIRWCFADQKTAADFGAAFGGMTWRRLFLRRCAHTAPRIDFLFGLGNLFKRGLVGLVGIFL